MTNMNERAGLVAPETLWAEEEAQAFLEQLDADYELYMANGGKMPPEDAFEWELL